MALDTPSTTSPPSLVALRKAFSMPAPIFWPTSCTALPMSSVLMPVDCTAFFTLAPPLAAVLASLSTISRFRNGATLRSASQLSAWSLSWISCSRHSWLA